MRWLPRDRDERQEWPMTGPKRRDRRDRAGKRDAGRGIYYVLGKRELSPRYNTLRAREMKKERWGGDAKPAEHRVSDN